jgi:LuxR family maltose regulon positive regulatory protein
MASEVHAMPVASASRGERRRQGPPDYAFQPIRTRLLDELLADVAAWPRVLSVVAPIGYGKTVLMTRLFDGLQELARPCFWIGLDDRDGDLGRVVNALEQAISVPGEEAPPLQALLPGYRKPELRLEGLLDSLAHLPEQSIIFIDNLNSCSDPALGQLLDTLIFRAPAGVHFIWSSSTRLPFNFARAKLQGLIRQIGLAELSLNEGETHALLGAELGGRIGFLGIEALLQQTEGWPAAIRLAQIILSDAAEPLAALETFSGSDEDIAALLNRHVLDSFAPELRAFVLALAPLRTFSIELARQATGSSEAASHIEFLLRRNVFIIPLDRQRKLYRLHGLFRSYLCSEAERLFGPAHRQAVLRRAAGSCEQSGELTDAVDYALAAGDMILTSRLVEQAATDAVRDRGNIPQYIRWLEHLQAAGVRLGWESEYWFAWSLAFSHRYEAGRQQLESLVRRLEGSWEPESPAPGNLARRIDHLRVCIDLFTDRLADTRNGMERWFAGEGDDHPHSLGSMYCVRAVCQINAFHLAQARQTMHLAESHKLQAGGAYGIGWISLINTLVWSAQGDFRQAGEAFDKGLLRIRQTLGDDSGLSGSMALVGMKCAVEMGLDERARDLLRLGLRTAGSHGLVETAACGFEAVVKLWDGQTDELLPISRMRELSRNYPLRLSLMLSCYLVQRLLRLGALPEAIEEARNLGLGPLKTCGAGPDARMIAIASFRDLFAATAIDLDIATGQIKVAEAAIGRELKLARSEGRAARQVELMLAQARIALCRNEPAAAMRELVLAIGIAARRRIVRPFRDQGALIASIVNDTVAASWSFSTLEERAFFGEICRQLPLDHPARDDKSALWNAEAGQSATPTRREVELLSLMDMGLSNQELANCSQLTVATVKWHLQNLYRKLGVANRSAALARARALNLLGK